ncbi:hypothetical protein EG328_001885 [Venturia inaequalis]|uniref:Uncharacterized protein n=1 Tax=Venturia inaequalis TaxID=5025 RepID=A0A8H3UXR2_VENIN|nr:hypothetical protein EG328_001885 [Venturia inaequalis]
MPASRSYHSRTAKHAKPSTSRILRSQTPKPNPSKPPSKRKNQNRRTREENNNDSHFLHLPREIRQRILLYTFTDEHVLRGLRLDVRMHEDEECSVQWVYGPRCNDDEWLDMEKWAGRLRNLHPVVAGEMRWVLLRWRARKEILGPMKQELWEAMFGDRFWSRLLVISSRGEFPFWYIYDDIVRNPRFDVIWGQKIRGTWVKDGPVLLSLKCGLDQSDEVKALLEYMGKSTEIDNYETGYEVVFERSWRLPDEKWVFR